MSLRSCGKRLDRLAVHAPRCKFGWQIRVSRAGDPEYQLTEADRCPCGILGHNILFIRRVVVVGRNEAGELIDAQGNVVRRGDST